MTLRLLLFLCLLTSTVCSYDARTCLTGYMTDIQTWVDEHGELTPAVEPAVAVDLSSKFDVVRTLRENLEYYISLENSVKYLSLAKCKLGRVPKIFHYKSVDGLNLSQTIEYLTLYGNSFMDTSSTGQQYQMIINATKVKQLDGMRQFRDGRNIWSTGFDDVIFTKLKELDLRACSIETIDNLVFRGMPNLEALYLGENSIYSIDSNAFGGLTNLVHLDISRNIAFEDEEQKPLIIKNNAFNKLKNLMSLDMSFTELHPRYIKDFKFGQKMQKLSLCWTGTYKLTEGYFKNTSIRYLDISGNNGILSDTKALKGLESTLQVLHATDIKLKEFEVFDNLRELEILKLTNNEINTIRREVAMSLRKLQVLDLDKNRYATWLHPTFLGMRALRFLTMRENNINVISIEMMNDIKGISYIGISGNFVVCNCHTRELIEMAAMNEYSQENKLIKLINNDTSDDKISLNFNTALAEYNKQIEKRLNVSYLCSQEESCNEQVLRETGQFLLIDYDGLSYSCLQATESKSIPFMKVKGCDTKSQLNDIKEGLNKSTNLLLLLILPGILLPIMLVLFVFRRRVRYFFVSMRNSATLSLISKEEGMDETKIYNYDVFVSYCHDDRAWMLDQLLPHLETECSVSVCLHERDFQVGLTILENIVSCMDRSRTIMLIISKKFLRSQWCQFEMHLAQHRLLETRREDLTLILLEDIPRSLRPNTLHYLMLTKTYIVWPKEESEQAAFWRRLKKSLVTQKNKFHDNVTLA